jgi:AcrR family transcriptional regulator
MADTDERKLTLQGEYSRQEILDAASRLMAAQGYAGTSMAHIAKESGLPQSSIYWHFSSKAGVLSAVMERGAERFFADLYGPPDEQPETGPDVLRRTLRRASGAILAHPEFLRLFILLLLSGGDDQAVVQRVRAEGRRTLHATLCATFAEHGEHVARKVADQLADYAVGIFDGAFLAIQNNASLSHPQLMELMADSLLLVGRQLAEQPARPRWRGRGP